MIYAYSVVAAIAFPLVLVGLLVVWDKYRHACHDPQCLQTLEERRWRLRLAEETIRCSELIDRIERQLEADGDGRRAAQAVSRLAVRYFGSTIDCAYARVVVPGEDSRLWLDKFGFFFVDEGGKRTSVSAGRAATKFGAKHIMRGARRLVGNLDEHHGVVRQYELERRATT